MAATIEEQVLTALKETLTLLGLTVQAGGTPLVALPPNTVQLTPLTLSREPSATGKQRWHYSVLVAIRSAVGSPTTGEGWAGVLTAVRNVLAAIDAAASLHAGGTAGVLSSRRGDVTYWCKPPARDGDPAGGLFEVTCDWDQ